MANAVGTRLAEGCNIHFSPVDKKPLCSYSNKVCRQRRLNGYGFCIRHILEDKSAPFKQCHFVTRNNKQKCLNAIPRNQERGYCHSHMQVAGIIPKTVKKVKQTNKIPPSHEHQTKSSNPSDSKLRPDTEHKESISHHSKSVPRPDSLKPKVKKKKVNNSTPFPNPSEPVPHPPPAKKKRKTETPDSKTRNDGTQIPKSKSKKKEVKNDGIDKLDQKSFNVCSRAFEQLKTLKILEKLSVGGESKLKWNDEPKLCSIQMSTLTLNENDNKNESRTEYLQRIRSSFQCQYKSLRHVVQIRDEAEVKLNETLRESVLACARLDPRRCATILRNGEDVEDDKGTGKVKVRTNKVNGTFTPGEKVIGPVRKKVCNGTLERLEAQTRNTGKSKKSKVVRNGIFEFEESLAVPKKERKDFSPCPPQYASNQLHLGSSQNVSPFPKQVPRGQGHIPGQQSRPTQTITPTLDDKMRLHCSSHEEPCSIQLENVLDSVTSSDPATPDGVITDTSFDSTFDHSPPRPDSDFGDVDELERSFELHIDPEIAHQASRLMEENGLTEEDFTDLFPESRLTEQKVCMGGELGLDLCSSGLDTSEIDYAIFSNIFPNSFQRPTHTESINNF